MIKDFTIISLDDGGVKLVVKDEDGGPIGDIIVRDRTVDGAIREYRRLREQILNEQECKSEKVDPFELPAETADTNISYKPAPQFCEEFCSTEEVLEVIEQKWLEGWEFHNRMYIPENYYERRNHLIFKRMLYLDSWKYLHEPWNLREPHIINPDAPYGTPGTGYPQIITTTSRQKIAPDDE